MTPTEDGTVWSLTAVTVAVSHRGKGLGEELVRLAIEDARVVGAMRLELVTLLEIMKPAWRLYEKLGFKRFKQQVVREQPRRLTVLWYAMEVKHVGDD